MNKGTCGCSLQISQGILELETIPSISLESPGCMNSSQQGSEQHSWNCSEHPSPATRAGAAKEFVACLGAKDLQLDCAGWSLGAG